MDAASVKPQVLVVEDEPIQLRLLVATLSALGTVEVFAAATVGQAVLLLDRISPEIVISDIDLPDRLGIELLGELGARGMRPYVVFASAYLTAFRAQIPRNPRVEVLAKPVPLETLRTIVRARTGQARVELPAQAPFGLADFLQMAGMGRRSVALEVWRGHRLGSVVVVGGDAWAAADGAGVGSAAFNRLFCAEGVQIRCLPVQPEPGPRNLEGPVEGLLLEAARLSDEAAHRAALQ